MNILISGLVNTETSVPVRRFPVEYYPVDYPFFGVSTVVSGVGFNISKAVRTLGDNVRLLSMTGTDFSAGYIREELKALGISAEHVKPCLQATPASVVLYDPDGRRQIYSDLKDIQETAYAFTPELLEDIDLVVACNIRFNRPLLRLAKAAGKIIATDVHVLDNVWDEYNRPFIEYADILFLSDEKVGWDHHAFLRALGSSCGARIIVMGRGSKGAALYLPAEDRIIDLPAARVGQVVNTVGAGDALFSSFVHYYAKGLEPVEALRRAQLFAAAKIRTSGASRGFVTEEEIEALYRDVE